VIMHWPSLLLPAQIVLLELIIDPACSVMFEAEPAAANLMERRPRAADASPFSWRNLAFGLLQGLGLAAILLLGCEAMLRYQWDGALVRTVTFGALVGGVFLLTLAHRTRGISGNAERNPWLQRLLLGVAVMLMLALGVPWLRSVLGFAVPSWQQAIAATAMLLAIWLWLLALRGASTRLALSA
jgi:P-type Ca2+ transporter type 2C